VRTVSAANYQPNLKGVGTAQSYVRAGAWQAATVRRVLNGNGEYCLLPAQFERCWDGTKPCQSPAAETAVLSSPPSPSFQELFPFK